MHKLPLLPEVRIYTDGSCIYNGQPGQRAASAAIILNGSPKVVGEYLGSATSQVAELQAAIIGIRAIKEPSYITIYSDSQYVVNCAMGKKKTHANLEYWDKLRKVSEGHHVEYVWVRGHDGNYWNEQADEMANSILQARHVEQDQLNAGLKYAVTHAPDYVANAMSTERAYKEIVVEEPPKSKAEKLMEKHLSVLRQAGGGSLPWEQDTRIKDD